ncbi:hypothetical protein ACFR97_10420 [Haloplanus litoreus]|uniref:Uncharacterized protein n=1 Tax=Haloplanus litoreus TaxID=767515 RepID=A0ABD6A3H5_9EURY
MATTDAPTPLREYTAGDTLEFELADREGILLGTVERVTCVGGECRVLLEQGVPDWRWRLVDRPGHPTTAAVRMIDGVAGWEDRGAVASVEVVA